MLDLNATGGWSATINIGGPYIQNKNTTYNWSQCDALIIFFWSLIKVKMNLKKKNILTRYLPQWLGFF